LTKKRFNDNIVGMRKFTQIPTEVYQDVLNGNLIGNDLVVYNYLALKAGHGKPIFFSNERICNDLGGMSYGKISASLGRLRKAKHILRKKTQNKTLTQLKTLVINGKSIIRGEPS
tara:strand:+ start:248 stop:592 length:345 start_codon:yes stop_codon:yes gene_type:complete